jgi:hypothetical protein
MVQYRDTGLPLPIEASTQPLSRTPPWQGTHPVLRFAQRYPWVFWSGLFFSMMLLIALAGVLLVTPLKSEAVRSKVTPIVAAPIAPPKPAEFSALWALGAITASCAVVSLLLTTSLSVANQRRRLIKHSKPAPNSEPRRRTQLELPEAANPPTPSAVATMLSFAAHLNPIATLPLNFLNKEIAAKNAVTPPVGKPKQ